MNNFKKVCFGAAVMAIATGVSLTGVSPAQALIISGTPTYTNAGAAPTTLGVDGEFNDGILTGGFTDVSGILVNSVTINPGSTTLGFNANYGDTPNFLSSFQYDGVQAVMNLLAGDLVTQTTVGGFVSTTAFDFSGEIRDFATNALLGTATGNISANQSFASGGNFSLDLKAVPIPTPALLPALLGMGLTAVRRQRKQAVVA
jgi:hypothetical protein